MNCFKKAYFATFLAISAVSFTHIKSTSFDPFEFLPQESLIKQECSKCGFGNFIFRNKKQEGCKYIRETLAKFNEPDPEPGLI